MFVCLGKEEGVGELQEIKMNSSDLPAIRKILWRIAAMVSWASHANYATVQRMKPMLPRHTWGKKTTTKQNNGRMEKT